MERKDKIFFTSDCHFGHDKISEWRGFDTVEAHDECLITNWNLKVSSKDRIYVLGDFVWHTKHLPDILSKLNGRIHWVMGNHDNLSSKKLQLFSMFSNIVWIKDVYMLKIKHGKGKPSTKIWLSHYPHEIWPDDHYGAFHMFGHIHGNSIHKPLANIPNRYDVGMDPNEFTPIEWDDVLQKLHDTKMWKKDYIPELKKAGKFGDNFGTH